MSVRRILRTEDGASLVLALAFVTFMGVFSVAILSFTGVGATTTTVVAAKTDQLYAADAGMEYGIANLEADPAACASSATATTWPSTTVNGKTVTYSCSYVSGGVGLTGSPLLGEYGTIVTGAAGISYSNTKSTAVTFSYGGSVHDAGALTFGTPASQTMPIDGNLTVASTCPTANVTYTSPGACTVAATPAPPTLSVYVPSATAAAATTSGTCTTLYPGKYGTGGRAIPSFSAGSQYYLASGVYYINGGTLTLNGTVFGGEQAASETKALSALTPCRASDPAGTGYSGTGVAFVFGGTAKLVVSNASAHVELFARVPGGNDAGATPGLGMWASTSSGSVLAGGTYVSSTSPAGIVTLSHEDLEFVAHGLTYVSSAGTQTNVLGNAEAGGSAVFAGGLVTSSLAITVNKVDDGKTMAVSGTGGWTNTPRTVTLTSTAAGTAGAAPTTVTATVIPDGTLSVTTWRVT